mmetsp:Transcript_65046/g.118700  ORF Transcript_65046/g.118700 Transcript_65046/m.118700 type:complete len:230 (+) Transcript_65046:711-1400(+)
MPKQPARPWRRQEKGLRRSRAVALEESLLVSELVSEMVSDWPSQCLLSREGVTIVVYPAGHFHYHVLLVTPCHGPVALPSGTSSGGAPQTAPASPALRQREAEKSQVYPLALTGQPRRLDHASPLWPLTLLARASDHTSPAQSPSPSSFLAGQVSAQAFAFYRAAQWLAKPSSQGWWPEPNPEELSWYCLSSCSCARHPESGGLHATSAQGPSKHQLGPFLASPKVCGA